MRGVLFHDGLDAAFVANYTTDNFTFVHLTGMPHTLTAGDFRFWALPSYLLQHREIGYLVVSDVSDVVFNQVRVSCLLAIFDGSLIADDGRAHSHCSLRTPRRNCFSQSSTATGATSRTGWKTSLVRV